MKSSVRNVRISPKKLNVIAYIIRGKTAQEALYAEKRCNYCS